MEKSIMNKKIIAAAVAATMTSVAFADISITGGMKVNYTNTDVGNGTTVTNAANQEFDLQVTGKSGDTTVYAELNHDKADGVDSDGTTGAKQNFGIEDNWLSTKIGDFTVKTGTWNGSDTILDKDSARANSKYEIKTSVAGLDITFDGVMGDADTNLKAATKIGDVAVSAKMKNAAEQYTLSTSIAGVSIDYALDTEDTANSDESSILVGTTLGGVKLEYAQTSTDKLAVVDGDSFFGDAAKLYVNSTSGMAAGDDISGFKATTDFGGNKVQFLLASVDDYTSATDMDLTKVVVTRPLAGGTTFEMVYTNEDSSGTTYDREKLDLELAVKF